jgi:hypothetical protein
MKVASTKSGVDYAYFGTGIINSDEAQQALPGTKVVFLVDLATGVSVTNGAEAVVEEVSKSYPNYLICYRDTLGEWSELKVRDGAFLSFGPWCAGHPSNEDVEAAFREITPIK